MPPPAKADKRYLEMHGNLWRVVVNVPSGLHAKLGRKLRHPLNTDSLREANRLKWDIVADFKRIIAEALDPALNSGLSYEAVRRRATETALELARERALAHDPERYNDTIAAISLGTEHLLGKPVGQDWEGQPVYEPKRESLAREFAALASGTRTPIDHHHERYLEASNVKRRTQADDKRALELLLEWCDRAGVPRHLQAITKREAVRFCDELPSLKPGLTPVTLNKYVSRLSVYWSWLENRHEVEDNVWKGRRLKEPMQTTDQKERPFTDEEMRRLLAGGTSQAMQDLMRIAALCGARLDAIVCLRVRDCQDNTFTFKPQKKEPGPRLCPIHPDLYAIIERRTSGKQADDDVFPEWPGPKKKETLRERSFKTSNEFTAYRRSVGVEDTREGKRRGLVNFHSFRRWFITKAEQAGQPESIIATVVGHKRPGMTFGVYSAGPLLEQARQCVEAVRLP